MSTIEGWKWTMDRLQALLNHRKPVPARPKGGRGSRIWTGLETGSIPSRNKTFPSVRFHALPHSKVPFQPSVPAPAPGCSSNLGPTPTPNLKPGYSVGSSWDLAWPHARGVCLA